MVAAASDAIVFGRKQIVPCVVTCSLAPPHRQAVSASRSTSPRLLGGHHISVKSFRMMFAWPRSQCVMCRAGIWESSPAHTYSVTMLAKGRGPMQLGRCGQLGRTGPAGAVASAKPCKAPGAKLRLSTPAQAHRPRSSQATELCGRSVSPRGGRWRRGARY